MPVLMGPAHFAVGVVTVGTTPTLISAAGARSSLVIYNNGSATVYIGGPSVTVATGWPVTVGEKEEVHGETAVYGVIAAGTADVRWIAESN